jgi:HAD superfamily hydrolase (TIGR01490 family)
MDHDHYYLRTRVYIQKTEAVNKSIAFFDFDGTITTKDTLLEFIKYSKGRLNFYLGFLINSPYLIAYKLKLIPNQTAKEKVLRYFFQDTPVSEFQKQCDDFATEILPRLIRPKAMAELRNLQKAGTTIVIVSASPENWIQKWAKENGFSVICTQLETNMDKLTGKLSCKNCYGDEKVRRIKEKFVLSDYQEIFAYGDSSGDKPMLQLATKPFFKPFRTADDQDF